MITSANNPSTSNQQAYLVRLSWYKHSPYDTDAYHIQNHCPVCQISATKNKLRRIAIKAGFTTPPNEWIVRKV